MELRHGAFGHVDDGARSDFVEARLEALKPRFTLYERANWVNRHPWLADLVIWRGRNSPRVLRRMASVLSEETAPGERLVTRLATGTLSSRVEER